MKKNFNSASKLTNFLLNIFFSIYVVFCIFPLLLVFMVSITNDNTISLNGYSIFPEKISFYAYQYIFSDSTQLVRSYIITIVVTIIGTIVSLLITSLYAYPLSKKDFKHKNFFAFIVYFTMLFNGGLVPWYMVYSKFLNLKDTIWVLIIPLLITPFYLLMMRTFFSTTIPDSITESAKIDGAGEYRIFFGIILPLSKPVLATVAMFNTLGYWNDWYTSLIFISDNKTVSLQFLMYKMMNTINYLADMSSRSGAQNTQTIANLPTQTVRMAMCILAIGPIVLAYPYFQKYFIKGLTIGAVKG
jgi:putative aldouronate transport system permease protein